MIVNLGYLGSFFLGLIEQHWCPPTFDLHARCQSDSPCWPKTSVDRRAGGTCNNTQVCRTGARKRKFRTGRLTACSVIGWTTLWPSSNWWIKTAHCEDNKGETTVGRGT